MKKKKKELIAFLAQKKSIPMFRARHSVIKHQYLHSGSLVPPLNSCLQQKRPMQDFASKKYCAGKL